MAVRQHWTAKRVADGLPAGAQLAALNTQLVQAAHAIRYTLTDLDDVTGVAANTLTFTGAYALGITLTAATAVTFPTSGTLAVAGAAPAAHQLDGALHTVSGLTTGHFLKATGATTFGFAAHGLTYSDVGADVAGAAAAVTLAGLGGITMHQALIYASLRG